MKGGTKYDVRAATGDFRSLTHFYGPGSEFLGLSGQGFTSARDGIYWIIVTSEESDAEKEPLF